MIKSLKFSHKILLAAALVVIATFSLFTLYNDSLQRTSIREDLEDYLHEMGEITASNVQNWLSGRILLIENLAQTLARDHSPETTQALLEQPLLGSTFLFTYLGQTDGTYTARPTSDLPADYDPRRRPWYNAATSAGQTTLTEPYMEPAIHELVLTIASPARQGGQPFGVVGGDLSLQTVVKIINSLDFGGMGYAFLVSGDGKILVHPDKDIGYWAPLLLCVLRFGQGLGLGGEWGGAALLATENAPAGKRAWFGMFPQLGPSIGFLAANGLFLALAMLLSEEQFRDWGWRIPFLLSAALVVVGLYVRLKLAETPVFAKAMAKHERVRLPIAELFAQHWRPTLLGALAMVVCYALFYISTVFSLSYGVASLGFSREEFLGLLCLAVLFMAAATPLSAWLSDRFGRKPVLLLGSLAAIASGFAMEPLLSQGSTFSVALFLCIELFLMGVTFAPMGALLPEIFPTHVRYTGASAAYNLGGILGASVAPYIAQKLVGIGGLGWVGGYVSAAALLSLLAVLCLKETRDNDLGAVS